MNSHRSVPLLNEIRDIKWMKIVGLSIALNLIATSFVSAQTVWLDQLDLSTATQGFGVPRKNKSVDGKTITIAGKTFEHGFGTHAESSLLIQLDKKAALFTA